MATKEDSASQVAGLSFIDWDSLDQDEFVKLEKIINDSKESPGVQLPFGHNISRPVKSQGNATDIEASVLHPAAPVFQPAMPPPSIVGFSIPMPAWTQDPNLPSTGPPHYPIPVHGGYVFPEPAMAVNGDVTVAFVTTLSNGQPVYAFPGHQIPPTFQPTPPHSHHHHQEGVEMSVSHSSHEPCPASQGDLMIQPVSLPGAVITPSPTHPLVMGPGATNVVPPPPHPGHIVPPSNGIPLPQTTQMMYITQMPPTPPSQTNIISSTPQASQEISNAPVNVPTMSKAISGLPPRQKKNPVIEFAGPILFDIQTSQSNASQTPKENKTAKKDPVSQNENPQPPKVKDDANIKIKTPVTKEVTVNVKCDEMFGHNHDQPSNVSGPSNTNVDKGSPPVLNSNAVSINSPKSPVSPHNVNSNNSDLSDMKNFPKMNGSHASPPSPSTLTPKDANTKEMPLKEKVSPPAPKMWSSLFGSKTANTKSMTPSPSSGQGASGPMGATTPKSNVSTVPDSKPEVKSVTYWQEQEKASVALSTPTDKVKPVVAKQDPLAPRLLEKLSNFPISHSPIVIQPRGLKNGKNTCFMNATLQVLMGCPPFVHMFRAFKNFPARAGGCSSTPIFDSLVLFVNSFQNGQRAKQNSRGKTKGNTLDLNVGVPFSPDPLLAVAQDILGLNIGVQHDAEEFLSQILSICHEELENIIKMDRNMDSVNNNSAVKNGASPNGHVDNFNHVEGFEDEDENDDSWQRVGPKNHSVETNINDCGQTPLSSIFAGLSRSCLQKESGKSSDTLDSFFTLKLDIQAESIHSVKDALLRLNTVEIVHDADGRKVHGQRRMFFDILPPVLIMHLKLFEYSNGNGQKIQKKISFDVDLQVPKEILSRVGRTKYSSPKSRSYKLFGVVNHHGIRMNDGHYTSDVYLPVANGWLHFDDSEVTATNEAQVLQYYEGSMPYLLFYRRLDAKE